MDVSEVVRSEQFPERAGDAAAALAYLALALPGEERQLRRVTPALAVRRHVTAAARELQGGEAKPKAKPNRRLRKLVGVAILAAVVIGALRHRKKVAAVSP